MLKPHIWAGRRFHGPVSRHSAARFETWLDDDRRWMLHDARLSQTDGIDVLAVGSELAGLTLREDAGRQRIRRVRAVYRGPLAHAAHRGEVLERIRF